MRGTWYTKCVPFTITEQIWQIFEVSTFLAAKRKTKTKISPQQQTHYLVLPLKHYPALSL